MKSPTKTTPESPTTCREMSVAVVNGDRDPDRSLEVSLADDGATFLVATAQPDGTDRSFAVHISRTDYLALMEHLRRHEAVLR